MAKKRNEVALEDRWDVEAFYRDIEAWKEDFLILRKEADSHFPEINQFMGKLSSSPESLAQFLKKYFDLQVKIESLYVYAHLRHDEDITIDSYKSAYQSIMMLYHAFAAETSWVEPEILQIDEKIFDMQSPSLAEYHNYLKQLIHQKQYILPKEQERIMAAAGDSLQTIPSAFSSINNADLKFEDVIDSEGKSHELTHASYQLLIKSNDRSLRKGAFLNMHARFRDFRNTVSDLLAGSVKRHLFNRNVRGFSSCLKAALYPYNIDESVYTNLIESVRAHFPVLHDYVSLRKELLNLDEIHAYDMYVPAIREFDKKYTFEEAVEIIIDSVAPLGEEYQSILRKGLTIDRWVDRYDNENKRSGAYSSGCYSSRPYILMNYNGTFNDLMTLSHEAGHSMHSFFSNRTQTYQDASYCIFVAEVASTFHEELTFRTLYERAASKEEKIYILNQKIDSIRATLFRQTMFAEFELKIHRLAEAHMPLTPDMMKKEYEALNRDYFGPSFAYDEELFYEFLRIPHFYSNFYVYQYATGISAAYALVERVLSGKVDAKNDYLQFLSSGRSDFPINLLKNAGVDMTTKEPVETLIKRFHELTKDLRALSL
ncbi:MAG: oligoendopeptidase F [Simkaniaceae bacterium]|nr:oligoendopeptidase F [Simkaniaceae bacterium]MCF7852649.1 oligoendopeptidase F [Simkaniaceae bacterium]